MHFPNRELEDVCYESSHIAAVEAALVAGLDKYFPRYVSGSSSFEQDADVSALSSNGNFKVSSSQRVKKPARPAAKTILENLAGEAIEGFERDQADYQNLLDEEALLEYGLDPPSFKSVALRNQCPIIRKTLQSKKEDLKRYRIDYNQADPSELHYTVTNLADFARAYAKRYRPSTFPKIDSLATLRFDELNTEDYTVFGVIGGGIKSHLLYKLYPNIFPYRSPDAVWALWFLVSKEVFGCRQDSEFLMINLKNSNNNMKNVTTSQNFFYPYPLFSLYALKLSRRLAQEWERAGAMFPEKHRFVILNNFLLFVAGQHAEETAILARQSNEYAADAY